MRVFLLTMTAAIKIYEIVVYEIHARYSGARRRARSNNKEDEALREEAEDSFQSPN